ncbi:hypothetical protein GE191_04495 [Serratia fonticola]|uniref:hypothetical protein n=1 Tax=Serratia fonticola TaxID=47917 RepID=UPI001378EC0A|nr:hypothetical protein [Serratia fonticola]NBJ32940.1 hypothetical protein [Serratia fonticola]
MLASIMYSPVNTATMMVVELDPVDRSYAVFAGIVGYGDLDFTSNLYPVNAVGNAETPYLKIVLVDTKIIGVNAVSTYYNDSYITCPSDDMFCAFPARTINLEGENGGPSVRKHCATVDPEISRNLWVPYANRWTGTKQNKRNGMGPRYKSNVRSISFSCIARDLRTTSGGAILATVGINAPGSITVVDPITAPPNASFCTFTTMPLITFVANTFDVTGSRRTETLHVQCTSGVPQNYTIRLLATSTDSGGRLLFNSGVSAQISLNGQNLDANGEKHVFPNMTTTDMLLAAELVGSSSDFGVSSASGVLILEIQ